MAPKRRQVGQASENGRTKQTSSTPNKGRSGRKKDKENGSVNGSVHFVPSGAGMGYIALVITLAIASGVLHRNHISTLFENDRHFSHLSTLERELAFRTEMGLYFSYYKTIIEAPSLWDGLHQVMKDNITEYPLTINTLKRFNLYPEVVLGIGFRLHEKVVGGYLGKPTKQCWQVNRGEGLSAVTSCEGLGEPAYFYVENVFLLNGVMMAIFFIYGTYLTNSVFGGLIAVLSYFYNHGECTRVMWTPPLRESFAYPFLVIQMFIVTYILRIAQPSYRHSVVLAIATVCFMLPWQFAQFALMTQTVAVFGTYILQYIGRHKMKIILLGQSMGLAVSYVLLFGNEMLLTSFFASCLVSVAVIVALEEYIEKLRIRILIWAVQGLLWVITTVGLKFLISRLLRVADDAHIGDIFRSKFSDFKNFHTQLYTCAAEFDFMEKETPGRILKTLLLPCVLIAVLCIVVQVLRKEYKEWKAGMEKPVTNGTETSEETAEDPRHRSKPHAEVLYNIFQLLAFTVMAIIIMRLKLFWTPHMCLVASLIASRQFFSWVGSKSVHYGLVVAIMAGMSVQGITNLQQQWSIIGEFSNYPMEEMVEWINKNTHKDAVFAGPMPTMATVKLCTQRPIVNHPHYEDSGLRERTKKVYSIYSRKPVEEVKRNLMDLHVQYVVLEDSWCVRRSRPGCGMAELWDLEDKANRHKPIPVCSQLREQPEPHFTRVFRNSVYDILQVNR